MKLTEWLTQTRAKKGEFAALIGVTPSAISHLCSGKSGPSVRVVAAIERETAGAVTAADLIPEDTA